MAAGATPAGSVADVAANFEIIGVTVLDDAQVGDVVAGEYINRVDFARCLPMRYHLAPITTA